MHRRQIFVQVAEVVLAELPGGIALRLQGSGAGDGLGGAPHIGPGLAHRGETGTERDLAGEKIQIPPDFVVVKYVGDTFLDLSCEKQPAHPDKKCRPVPAEGPPHECLSVGRVASVAV